MLAVQTNTTRRDSGGAGSGIRDEPRLLQVQREVGAPPVALGTTAGHQTGILEGLQVVGQKVGGELGRGAEFGGGGVAGREQVDDLEPVHVTEGGMNSRSSHQLLSLLTVH